MINQKLRDYLQKYTLISNNNILLVAFSGGLDSLCLLHSLQSLPKELLFTLKAIHINHQWRDEESNTDEKFVKEYCKSINIELFTEKLDPNLPKTELVAREKRYELFNTIANKNNIPALLTAHTKSDQVETILYRIIKGTGQNGLIGIPEIRQQNNGPTIYRPLLECTRAEIEQYAKENNLKGRTDSSNFDNKYLRNSIRNQLLPNLKQYNTQIEEALLRLSTISEQNEKALTYLLKDTYNNIFENKQTIITNQFIDLPAFIKPQIIMKLLSNNNITYEFKMIELLLNHIENTVLTHAGKKYPLIKNFSLHVNNKYIKIVSSKTPTLIDRSTRVIIPGVTKLNGTDITLKITEYKEKTEKITFPDSKSYKALVDLSQITSDIYLRTRKPGDIINPIGMKGHMKLKKYLINEHIPQEEKDSIPVISTDNEILWLAGFCLSNKIKVNNVPTHVFEIIRG